MKRKVVGISVALLAALLPQTPANAATVGPGTAFQGGNAYPIGNQNGGNAYAAVQFQVMDAFQVSALDVVVGKTTSTGGTFNFDVRPDLPGGAIGPDFSASLVHFSFLTTTGNLATQVIHPTLAAGGSALSPGTSYWLVGSATDLAGTWNTNGTNYPPATVRFDLGIGLQYPDVVSPSYLLHGSAPTVPLPLAVSMGLVLLLATPFLRGRRPSRLGH